MRKKVIYIRPQERINFMRGLDEQMRTGKEPNILNSVNQQTPKMNKEKEKKKQYSK
jgi:hypothetical protein